MEMLEIVIVTSEEVGDTVVELCPVEDIRVSVAEVG